MAFPNFGPKKSPEADLSGLTTQVEALAKSVAGLEKSTSETMNAVKVIHNNQTNMQENFTGMQQQMAQAISHLALAFFLLCRQIFPQESSWISHRVTRRGCLHQIDAKVS